jgi:predicted protein tyrosine phosphatase
MNILFVCSSNKLRSRTAEDYFYKKYPDFVFGSAGTNKKSCQKEGTTFLTEDMLDWADLVYVMETKHKKQIKSCIGDKYDKKIRVIDIPDKYKYFQKELIALLEKKCKFT